VRRAPARQVDNDYDNDNKQGSPSVFATTMRSRVSAALVAHVAAPPSPSAWIPRRARATQWHRLYIFISAQCFLPVGPA
jgi:hypothetical protein